MSKKDYQAIARAIYATHQRNPFPESRDAIRDIQETLANLFATENARFDRARFLEACETGRCKGMRGVAA